MEELTGREWRSTRKKVGMFDKEWDKDYSPWALKKPVKATNDGNMTSCSCTYLHETVISKLALNESPVSRTSNH